MTVRCSNGSKQYMVSERQKAFTFAVSLGKSLKLEPAAPATSSARTSPANAIGPYAENEFFSPTNLFSDFV